MKFGRQSISDIDIKAVEGVLRGEALTTGPMVGEFEQHLAGVTGAKYAVACSSGTAALHLACLALGVKQGDVGVTSPITFVASANCFEYCGASTDFVDVDENSICMDPDSLRALCKVRPPQFVIAVDFAGIPAPWRELRDISDEFGFKLIADCAHSIGSTFADRTTTEHSGSCKYSDVAVFSFHPLKNITTGEGGAVTTNCPDTAYRLRSLRSHGLERDPLKMERFDGPWSYELKELGYNYRLTDFQCALGISQLQSMNNFKQHRRGLVELYRERLSDTSKLRLLSCPDGSDPCFHLFPIQFVDGAGMRLNVYEKLKKTGILTQVHYIPVHTQRYYRTKYGFDYGKCPRAEHYYSCCLSLPLHYGLSKEDVVEVCDKILDIVRE